MYGLKPLTFKLGRILKVFGLVSEYRTNNLKFIIRTWIISSSLLDTCTGWGTVGKRSTEIIKEDQNYPLYVCSEFFRDNSVGVGRVKSWRGYPLDKEKKNLIKECIGRSQENFVYIRLSLCARIKRGTGKFLHRMIHRIRHGRKKKK